MNAQFQAFSEIGDVFFADFSAFLKEEFLPGTLDLVLQIFLVLLSSLSFFYLSIQLSSRFGVGKM
jgi:hypothetical protein